MMMMLSMLVMIFHEGLMIICVELEKNKHVTLMINMTQHLVRSQTMRKSGANKSFTQQGQKLNKHLGRLGWVSVRTLEIDKDKSEESDNNRIRA